MGKHVYTTSVLVCTLSTRFGANERTLPGREIGRVLFKKVPGID